MRSVKIRTESGDFKDAFDIRKPIGLQVEYEILKPGFKLMIYFRVWNEEGIELFCPIDNDPDWRKRPRPTGKFVSIAWIPGNFLAEGTFFIGAAIRSLEPMTRHCAVRNAVAFQTIDTMDGDSARVDHGGWLRGVVRPMLKWETQFHPQSPRPSNPGTRN
jgi:lipopolysaccharide transport system ATP-binding protein